MLLKTLKAALAAGLLAAPAWAEITVQDAYARASSPTAPTGAAFMELHNSADTDDRLIAVASGAAARVELHTHIDMGDGVMQMTPVEDGIVIPAGGHHALARGGDHIMMMGLTAPLTDGMTITVTLTFEQAGEITVDIPVDLDRQPKTDHSGH